MKKYKYIILVSLLFTTLLSTNIYAIWQYYTPSQSFSSQIPVTFSEWFIELPGEELSTMGKNHQLLLSAVINNPIGLNTPNSILNSSIEKRKEKYETFGSMGVVTGGNIKDLFVDINGNTIENIEFLIQFEIDDILYDDLYYIYTFNTITDKNEGDTIEAYRTTLKIIDGTWVSTGSEFGTAPIVRYIADQGNNKTLTIDHTKWIKTKMPET